MAITIFGYGSLLSKASTLRTCPSMKNHRVAAIRGYERIFSLVSISQLRNGNSNVDLNQIAALAVRRTSDPTTLCIGTVFEIEEADMVELKKREHRYDITEMNAFDDGNTDSVVRCLVFTESNDSTYKAKCDAEGTDVFETIVGQYYSGMLWGRQDIYPVTKYLHYCCNAASQLVYRGDPDMCQQNFLQSLLADGTTTIGEYMQNMKNKEDEEASKASTCTR